MLFRVVPTASNPMTAAAMARAISSVLTAGRARAGAIAGRGAAGAERVAVGAAAVARGALGTWAGAAALGAAGAVAAGPPLGPPGGRVGSLMVGAAEGLGGKLMRTVSFFGWTFPVSFFGGTAPLGMLGMFSAIKCISFQIKVAALGCQTLIPVEKSDRGRIPGTRPLSRAPCFREVTRGGGESPNRGNGLQTPRRRANAGEPQPYTRASPAPRRSLFQRGARSSRGRATLTVSARPWNSLP
jgi:hypothetical protein